MLHCSVTLCLCLIFTKKGEKRGKMKSYPCGFMFKLLQIVKEKIQHALFNTFPSIQKKQGSRKKSINKGERKHGKGSPYIHILKP